MAEGLTNLLAEMGFAYTTRVNEIIPLLPGVNRVVVVPKSWPGDRNDYASKRRGVIRVASR